MVEISKILYTKHFHCFVKKYEGRLPVPLSKNSSTHVFMCSRTEQILKQRLLEANDVIDTCDLYMFQEW